MERDTQALLDMFQSAELVLVYLKDVTESDFYRNVQVQDAVIRRLLVVGEAASRVSISTQNNLPDVAWPQMRGMRNRLVHEYDGIDLVIVWQTTQTVLPTLIVRLERYLQANGCLDR